MYLFYFDIAQKITSAVYFRLHIHFHHFLPNQTMIRYRLVDHRQDHSIRYRTVHHCRRCLPCWNFCGSCVFFLRITTILFCTEKAHTKKTLGAFWLLVQTRQITVLYLFFQFGGSTTWRNFGIVCTFTILVRVCIFRISDWFVIVIFFFFVFLILQDFQFSFLLFLGGIVAFVGTLGWGIFSLACARGLSFPEGEYAGFQK